MCMGEKIAVPMYCWYKAKCRTVSLYTWKSFPKHSKTILTSIKRLERPPVHTGDGMCTVCWYACNTLNLRILHFKKGNSNRSHSWCVDLSCWEDFCKRSKIIWGHRRVEQWNLVCISKLNKLSYLPWGWVYIE